VILPNTVHSLRGPPSLLYNGYRVFPGGKGGRGVMLTTHPLLVPRLRKSRAIPPFTLWVLLGLLRGSLYLYLCTVLDAAVMLRYRNHTFQAGETWHNVQLGKKSVVSVYVTKSRFSLILEWHLFSSGDTSWYCATWNYINH
jgi:hypothetical protein